MGERLLSVEHMSMEFYNEKKPVRAIRDVSFHVDEGEILGVVGESGCGKSVTSMCIMRLIPEKAGHVTEGKVIFQGKNILETDRKAFSKVVGKEMSMIFQEPLSSLNPLLTCGYQIAENLILHEKIKKKEAMKKAVRLLETVGIPFPEKRAKEYPHQLSGGMRQRVMIAMAIACSPKLLIADEPTTALDVTIQAQILEIIKKLRDERGMSVMFITHDMGVIAEMADKVMVMYAGSVVEKADVKSFFKNPRHPYTKNLLKAIPRIDKDIDKLFMIPGTVPDLSEEISGCRFCQRCKERVKICNEKEPPTVITEDGHEVTCWLLADTKQDCGMRDSL